LRDSAGFPPDFAARRVPEATVPTGRTPRFTGRPALRAGASAGAGPRYGDPCPAWPVRPGSSGARNRGAGRWDPMPWNGDRAHRCGRCPAGPVTPRRPAVRVAGGGRASAWLPGVRGARRAGHPGSRARSGRVRRPDRLRIGRCGTPWPAGHSATGSDENRGEDTSGDRARASR